MSKLADDVARGVYRDDAEMFDRDLKSLVDGQVARVNNVSSWAQNQLRIMAEMARDEFKRAPEAAKGHDCVYMGGYEDACDHLSMVIAQAAVIDSVRIAGPQPDWQYHIALLLPDDAVEDAALLKIYIRLSSTNFVHCNPNLSSYGLMSSASVTLLTNATICFVLRDGPMIHCVSTLMNQCEPMRS